MVICFEDDGASRHTEACHTAQHIPEIYVGDLCVVARHEEGLVESTTTYSMEWLLCHMGFVSSIAMHTRKSRKTHWSLEVH